MKCFIIAGSPDTDTEFIAANAGKYDLIICADKGYYYARKAGVMPDVVIGDFDSFTGELPSDCEVIRLNVRKNDTDTAVCADVALERGCTEISVAGATGGRLDHTYANLCLLEYILSKDARGELVSFDERIMLLKEGSFAFDGLRGKTFSVFPFGCDTAVASICGAEYPVEDFKFYSGITRGLSNVFSDNCKITVKSGKLLLIINLNEV